MRRLARCVFGVAVCAAAAYRGAPLVGTAQEAGTGVVRGQVHVVSRPARRLATAGAYPSRVVGIQPERETSELDNVVVFVDVSTPDPPPARHVTIRQADEEFVPHVVAITVGSTVEFPNDDPIFHNVFSLSRAATFDLGRYPRDTSKARTFTKPGIVKVFCHLHSHMSAIVRVFPHTYYAMPDREGRFTIPGVPAGRHGVTAWHERAGEVVQSAIVEEGGAAELSFSLPLTDPQ